MWNTVSICNLCDKVVSGGTPSSKVTEYYLKGTIPWLKTKEVQNKRIYATETFITQCGFENSSAKMIPVNSIIIAMYGDGNTAGKVAINKIPLTTNQACCNLILNKKIVDCEFVFYNLLGRYDEIVNMKTGSGQQNLNLAIIKSIPITIPDLKIQRKISKLLGSFDLKIEKNNEQISSLLEMLQTLYQSWFCDASIHEHWEKTSLGTVIEKITKKNSPIQTEITITISAKDGITSEYYSKRVASKDLSKYTVVEKGDFIYNRSSSTGYPVGVICRLEEFDKVALSPIYFCFRSKNIVSSKFLQYYLSSEPFTISLYQIVGIGSRGHGMLNFSMRDFMGIEVYIPPASLQEKFENTVAPFEQKIAKLKEENIVLAEIRDALLPKLMSGELPVEVGEE